jgi:glycosyltransferase involved in cell wall biosynthesis
MKVLHLDSSSGYYGKEAVIINLCSALEALGCSTEIGAFLNSHAPNDEVVARAQQRGLSAGPIACRGRIDFRAVRAIRDRIVEQQIDLVHSHDYKASLYGYLAARWAGRPAFATCHLWYYSSLADRVYGAIDRAMLRYFDGIVAVSPHIADVLRAAWIPQRKISVIANGIDLAPFLEVEDATSSREFGNEPTIGIVGRLTHQKGHAILFEAVPAVLAKFPAADFVIVGEGSDRAQLDAQAQKLGITGNVHFAGYRADMPAVYSALDLMVMPSLDEGLPMTLLEGMAAKRAWIASAVGAVPEVIQHGQNGVLIKPGSVTELQDAIILLLQDKARRQQIAENARRSSISFSAERMARNYLEFYKHMGVVQPRLDFVPSTQTLSTSA